MVDDLKQGGEELHHQPEPPKSAIAKREEKILEFWNKEGIFEKSLAKPAPKGEYVFYDGPPFATGLPHYGHLLQSAIKDAVPRYQTMRGYHVPRVWGWDCHGLPLENQIEQELGIKTKRDIEQLGIEKFNKAARDAVLRYADDWKKIIPRFGRWVDMEHDYRTMDASYTESVWWAFKNLYTRGLAYEGFKSMHLCPRCGTTLSNFEVAQGYKDIEDLAVTVKLQLIDEPKTSLLVWTTTPWTLPGNAAAAVKADAAYIKVKVGEEFYIVAKELLGKLLEKSPGGGAPKFSSEENFGGKDFLREDSPVVQEFLGKDLVGKKYLPPFDYFENELHKHKTHAWRVYAADFVTLNEGTGIVHIAPAFGADDLTLAQKEKIPLIHHVTDEGKFIATVKDFAHLPVKPKGNPKETDAKIVEWLREHDLLFKADKIKHSYPHCWRCDTPLLNWAANSWFVNVQKVKSKLLSENANVHWVPEHVGRGRFNNGLQSAPDWAISRARFWGAPLPVWCNSKTKQIKVLGSVDEMLSMVRRSGNRYFVMRHGEAMHNVQKILDPNGDPNNHLTDKGRLEAVHTASDLKREKIDLIITSQFVRTRETAAIVQKELGLPDSAVMVDERLHEYAENISDDVRKRVGELLFEVERRYSNKNILFVTHGRPLWTIQQVAGRQSGNNFSRDVMLNTGQVRELPFVPYPHNENYELDLHRPYIDDVSLGDSLAGEWKRVPDVFDCWFESGSMPYASHAYPHDKKKKKDEFNPKRFFGLWPKGYPADFIAESIDQTRGWFYSLIVLGVALFNKTPYKAVVTNGLVLAEDGRKMSKKLKNYPDPMEMVEQYGADAVRYYLLSSSVIRGEDLRFAARGVEEVSKKLLMRLDNVRSFYELYAPNVEQKLLEKSPGGGAPKFSSEENFGGKDFLREDSVQHVLDKWILSRLGEMVRDITAGFEKYELDNATRPLGDFVDDLSTWYVRRSRDRFKTDSSDKDAALYTLRTTLYTLSQVMAPTMPFYAEYLYQQMKGERDAESVHLTNWPEPTDIDEQLLEDMKQTRDLASTALQMREKAGIKLRQPLATLKAKILPKNIELQAVLADEINVKEVTEDSMLADEAWLDLELTQELKEEGTVRNLMRAIQEWRKEQKLNISDRPDFTLEVAGDEKKIADKYTDELMQQTGLKSLTIQVKREVKEDA